MSALRPRTKRAVLVRRTSHKRMLPSRDPLARTYSCLIKWMGGDAGIESGNQGLNMITQVVGLCIDRPSVRVLENNHKSSAMNHQNTLR